MRAPCVCSGRPGKLSSAGEIGDAGNCERPRRIYCHGCTNWIGVRCNSGSRAKCGPCSELHRGDLKAVARSGWVGQLAASCLVFLTLTAPGRDEIVWDTDKCMHAPGPRPCNGKRGCTATTDSLALWNTGLTKRWSYFRQHVRRHLPPGCDVAMCKSWELQRRGALHVHAMLRFTGPCTFDDVKAALESYRATAGWGEKMDVQAVPVRDELQIARRAGYIAKYCTKGYDDLQDVPVMVNGYVQTVRMSPFSKSENWGLTLASCRKKRSDFWANGGRVTQSPDLGALGGAAALDLYTDSSTWTPSETDLEHHFAVLDRLAAVAIPV